MQITLNSIRKLSQANDEYAYYYEQAIKKGVSEAKSGTPRNTLRPYKQPASLWGRIKVALSGTAARRERACARLNALYSVYHHEGPGTMGLNFNKVAMLKFVKAYEACPSNREKGAMIRNLRDEELRDAARAVLVSGAV